MQVNAFLSILALREKGTLLFRMDERALFITQSTVREMSTFDFLLIILVCTSLFFLDCLFYYSLSDIVFVLTQVYYSVSMGIYLYFFLLRVVLLLSPIICFYSFDNLSLESFTFELRTNVSIISILSCPLFAYSIHNISFPSIFLI